MKRIFSTAAVAALLAAGLTGCADPCQNLAPPTQSEKDIVIDGAEVEREINGTECELGDNGKWEADS